MIVAVAVLAALAAGAVVVITRSGSSSPESAAGKPLTGTPPVVLELPTAADGTGAAQVLRAAQQQLPAGDVRVAVARAMAAYSGADPGKAIGVLERLDQHNPAVTLNLGLAEFWAGRTAAATATLEQTKRLDPYGFYGGRADDTLHLNMARGYPLYFPSTPVGTATLVQRQAAVRSNPNDAAAWLALAVMLEQPRGGRPADRIAAIAAARHAVEAAPTDISPRVALAVLSFDKDRPSESMGTLGTLLQNAAGSSEIRFHVGMLAFWLGLDDQAVGEFRQVAKQDPSGPYAKLSDQLARCVSSVRDGGSC